MKNKKIWIPAVLCALSLILMTAVLLLDDDKNSGFTPPPFELAACRGTPQVQDKSYMRVYQDGMQFSAHICGEVAVENQQATVFFTNDKGNSVWMKLRILDEAGNILGESGLLKPEEYVSTLSVSASAQPGTKVKLKIMAYEPETYFSAGSVTLNTILSDGGN